MQLHHLLGELVLGFAACSAAPQEGSKILVRDNLGATSFAHGVCQTEMIVVLMGQQDQIEVFDPIAVLGKQPLKRCE